MSPKMRAHGSPDPPPTGGQAEPQQLVPQTSALGDDGPMLREEPEAHLGAYRAPAVLDPTTPPGVAAEGGPTTPLTSAELPRWIHHPRVDSQAMLSAFLAYRGRCTGEAHAQLDHLYMIVHRHEPTVVVGGQVIRPQEIHPPGLPTQPCTAQGCARCLEGRGGYQFKWYHPRWRAAYVRLRRKVPPEDAWHPYGSHQWWI